MSPQVNKSLHSHQHASIHFFFGLISITEIQTSNPKLPFATETKPPLPKFPKIGVKPPNHPFVHRVFHYFHHPFWGTIIFGNTHIWVPQQEAVKESEDPLSNQKAASAMEPGIGRFSASWMTLVVGWRSGDDILPIGIRIKPIVRIPINQPGFQC